MLHTTKHCYELATVCIVGSETLEVAYNGHESLFDLIMTIGKGLIMSKLHACAGLRVDQVKSRIKQHHVKFWR